MTPSDPGDARAARPSPPPAAAATPPPPPARRPAAEPPGRRISGGVPAAPAEPRNTKKFCPQQPRTLQEAGLTGTMVEELILKAIFFAGEMRGMDIAHRLKLPTAIVDEVIEGLRRQKYIDIRGGGSAGVGQAPR